MLGRLSVKAGYEIRLKTGTSEALFERAKRVLPGGVSSPVRAFQYVGGTPVFIRSGAGSMIEDEDGNQFIDYCMSWGTLILGHAHPTILRALVEAAASGTTFGTPTVAELELAELITTLYPSAEQVRFVSSGTEAVMSAVRVARGVTGRDLIVKFDGCYHGHADYLLVKAGSGLVTSGIPDSAGVPASIAETCAILPLNDVDGFRAFMNARGRQVAGVLVEGVPANAGLLIQDRAFWESLRTECARHGTLLIFDEVITGFRLGAGGAAALYGVMPDLIAFGKVIGGGLPVGAYGGHRSLMEHVAPSGPIYQAGTLSGNPLAMAAGKVVLENLRTGGWKLLEDRARTLEAALTAVIVEAPGPIQLVRIGSIFWITFQERVPRTLAEVDRSGAQRYARFHRMLLEHGVYLPPSAFEVFFVSTTLKEEDIAQTSKAFGEALRASV